MSSSKQKIASAALAAKAVAQTVTGHQSPTEQLAEAVARTNESRMEQPSSAPSPPVTVETSPPPPR